MSTVSLSLSRPALRRNLTTSPATANGVPEPAGARPDRVRAPSGPRPDPVRIPSGSRPDPVRIPSGSRPDPGQPEGFAPTVRLRIVRAPRAHDGAYGAYGVHGTPSDARRAPGREDALLIRMPSRPMNPSRRSYPLRPPALPYPPRPPHR
ncbi:hypothetical protein GCM10020227_51490 [Streptomyces flavovirens]